MNPDLEKRIAALAADRESGASQILAQAVAILRDAAADDLPGAAAALRRAQPSMAPVWNAADAALRGMLDRFARRAARAPQAIARSAVGLVTTGLPAGAPVRVTTISSSGTVAHVMEQLRGVREVRVACSESRPALEGRGLAARLSAAGIAVTLYADSAIDQALESCDVVLVGADAIAAEWFLNKSGTRMLAASAMQRGIPVYVLAGDEKFVSPAVADQLAIRESPPAEVWVDPPPGVSVRNRYFERVPVELAAAVVSDAGVLSAADVRRRCG